MNLSITILYVLITKHAFIFENLQFLLIFCCLQIQYRFQMLYFHFAYLFQILPENSYTLTAFPNTTFHNPAKYSTYNSNNTNINFNISSFLEHIQLHEIFHAPEYWSCTARILNTSSKNSKFHVPVLSKTLLCEYIRIDILFTSGSVQCKPP